MTWKEILTYLDDLNVIGTGFQNHLQNLWKSIEYLCQYNLKLKPHKCCLFPTEVPFLGRLVHIKEYAHISAWLYNLTGPRSKFDWTASHQAAFERLQDCLVCVSVLSYPNNQDTFILDTDASDITIGAELLQVLNGEEKVICCGSFSLTPCQQRYCTTQKEFLAAVWFCREYHYYLLRCRFIVRTDHSSLTWLM